MTTDRHPTAPTTSEGDPTGVAGRERSGAARAPLAAEVGPDAGDGRGEHVAPADWRGRLDHLLATRLPDLSRSRVQALIRDGQVSVDGRTILEPGRRIKPGETVSVEVPPPADPTPQGEDIPLAIVYEDDHLIVVDKPAGLVVHPAPGHAGGTLVNALIAHCGTSLSGIGGVRRPGIVHRLDKETSGLLVVAKSDVAHQGLSAQFAAHGADGRLERAYLAVAWGAPLRPDGVVDLPLTRASADRKRIAVAPAGTGRRAVTHYEVLARYGVSGGGSDRARRYRPAEAIASLLRLNLETGRTHQIRVHLAAIGHPLLGDPLYARGFATRAVRLEEEAQAALAALGRQALHAAVLGFEHPVSGLALRFESALPADLARLVDALAR